MGGRAHAEEARSRRWCSAGVLINGLAVHRLPQGARLDAGGVEGEEHGLDVGVGLEVGVGRLAGMGHTCGTAHGAGDNFGIGLLLALHAKLGRQSGRAQPVVRLEVGARSLVHLVPSTLASSSS